MHVGIESKVIERAMIACENSGHDVFYDFVEVSKIVDAGATNKPIKDYELSRYACYLIVQNSDPRKEVIALGQTYFAIFQNAGYMGSTELIANLFRISQTEKKIEREQMAKLKAKAKKGTIMLDE